MSEAEANTEPAAPRDGGVLGMLEEAMHTLADKAIAAKKIARTAQAKAERARRAVAAARRELERIREA